MASRQLASGSPCWHGCRTDLPKASQYCIKKKKKRNPDQKHADLESNIALFFPLCAGGAGTGALHRYGGVSGFSVSPSDRGAEAAGGGFQGGKVMGAV